LDAPTCAGRLVIKPEQTESQLDILLALPYSWLESQLYMTRTITNRIKELRTARGWTQEQLALAAGVSRQSINSIERNRYVPSLELALIFARLFACSTEEIFQLENEK
jgi:putative transcriptional regulator